MYNGEKILERLEELYNYIELFPNSEIAPIVRNEIAHLESLRV